MSPVRFAVGVSKYVTSYELSKRFAKQLTGATASGVSETFRPRGCFVTGMPLSPDDLFFEQVESRHMFSRKSKDGCLIPWNIRTNQPPAFYISMNSWWKNIKYRDGLLTAGSPIFLHHCQPILATSGRWVTMTILFIINHKSTIVDSLKQLPFLSIIDHHSKTHRSWSMDKPS